MLTRTGGNADSQPVRYRPRRAGRAAGPRGRRSPRGAVHAAARVGRGRAQVEAPDRRSRRDPIPGTGRNTSCWCSWAVPPLTAPPTRFALRASSSRGPEHPPGQDPARRSRAPALDPRLHAVGEPFAVVVVPVPADPFRRRRRTGPLGDVGVGPHRLGAGRRPGGVAGRHLPGEHEGLGRDRAATTTCPSASSISPIASAMCTVPGAYAGAVSPRHRPVQRPVDLHRAGVELEGGPCPARPGRGRRRRRQQAAEQVRRATSAMHRPPGPHPVAGRGPDPGRPAPVTSIPTHLGVATDLAAAGDSNLRTRARARSPAPPSGTGKPTVWPSIVISSPISPEPGASRGMSVWAAFPARSTAGAHAAEAARGRARLPG